MITDHINFLPGKKHVYLDYFGNELSRSPLPAMLVIPGGGYTQVCYDREGDPIALSYLMEGMNCFVLHYSVGDQIEQPTDPLYEAAMAMLFIRQNAYKYDIDPERIYASGFSAGGHLAASLGILWDDAELQARLNNAGEVIRPRGVVLCYAVISSENFGHRGSFVNLLGSENPPQDRLDRFSLEKHVRANSAPAFIMHTFDDPVVPVKNALSLGTAYSNAGVGCEMHIYPHGPHGIALATDVTAMGNPEEIDAQAARWVHDSIVWMRTRT